MSLSSKLAQLNYNRYQEFSFQQNHNNANTAIYSFKGDVYDGFDVNSLSGQDIEYCQNHLRILSGLYGILKPLDLIQPYRLEMGTVIKIENYKNLYQFWADDIANEINKINDDIIVNLASEEYFRSVNKKILKAQLVTPVFKERKGKEYKIIMVYAKKARGMMANFIIKNKLTKLEELKNFSLAGYEYNPKLSKDNQLTFIR